MQGPTLIVLLCLFSQIFAQQSPFATEYDFIIVGGGTAGLTLATRLSETNATVLVLEAGPAPDQYASYLVPLQFEFVLNQPIDWAFNTVPQASLNGRTINYHAGRALGGSSCINYMAYARGSAAVYNSWQALGNDGWAWSDVEPYFVKGTTFSDTRTNDPNLTTYDPEAYDNGPLPVSFGGWDTTAATKFVAAGPSIGVTIVEDLNNGTGVGVNLGVVTINSQFQRSCAYNTYYAPIRNRPNLTVRPLAWVDALIPAPQPDGSILIEGVSLIDQQTAGIYAVLARKEVILSAGAFQTPQLLMLSGIGPKDVLENVGVPVLVENENVGKNLQDSQFFTVFAQTANGSSEALIASNATASLEAIAEYDNNKTGIFTSPVGFTNAFERLSTTELSQLGADTILAENRTNQAHLQYSYAAAFYPAGSPVQKLQAPNEDYFSISISLSAPSSRGSVSISSNVYYNPPVIDLNFYNTTEDINLAIYGFNQTRKLLASSALKSITVGSNNGEVAPGPSVQSDEEILNWIRTESTSNYNACGTCAMLPQAEGGVVDSRLRVYGVSGLRVVDASIFPLIPDANIQAAVYMTAEKAADMIKEDWGYPVS